MVETLKEKTIMASASEHHNTTISVKKLKSRPGLLDTMYIEDHPVEVLNDDGTINQEKTDQLALLISHQRAIIILKKQILRK